MLPLNNENIIENKPKSPIIEESDNYNDKSEKLLNKTYENFELMKTEIINTLHDEKIILVM